MTRKEELKQRAITIVDEFPICFETETEKKEYQEYVFDMLRKVELEVWEKVIAGYLRYKESLVPKPGCEKFPTVLLMSFEEWCKSQQQELT